MTEYEIGEYQEPYRFPAIFQKFGVEPVMITLKVSNSLDDDAQVQLIGVSIGL